MNNRQLIGRSLDMRYYRSRVITVGVISLIFYMLILTRGLPADVADVMVLYGVLYALITTVFVGVYVYKICAIRKAPEGYRSLEGTVTSAHPTVGRRLYLLVEVTDTDGTVHELQTKAVFSPSVLSGLYYGAYFNQRLHVLWDDKTDRLVAVGKLDP